MKPIPLRLGPLRADGCRILRSGIRWLLQPGDHCRANQVFAYCNISMEGTGISLNGLAPFADEAQLQVAFAPRTAGRIVDHSRAAHGGYLSVRSVDVWDADDVIAHIEPGEESSLDVGRLRLLVLAGRQMTALADVPAGLLGGWLGRTRGWWCEERQTPVSLLGLGICDVSGVVTGEQCAFLEMFEEAAIPMQLVSVPDHPLAPTAPVLLDQLERKPAQFQAIAEDLHRFFSDSAATPSADDWMISGALLSSLQRSPILDNYSIITSAGTMRVKSADAVMLSLSAEPQSILRHKSLGYHLHIMRHRLAAAGPVFRSWLGGAFETVKRSVDDIRSDYQRLIDTMHSSIGARTLVVNRMSTSGHETVSNYSPFDAPLSETLSSVAAKELNLMLHDLAEHGDVAIIDVDAIAADLGGARHLPDGIHQSGLIQTALRSEVLETLKDLQPANKLR